MTTPSQFKTGTLGNRATFAGEAARTMRGIYPFLSEPVFFPSMPACWQAVETGAVEVLVIGVERTGQPHQGHPIIKSGLHVIGQAALPLACNLYVKPGTKLEAVRRITGHGSVHQCESYLERHFPGVPRLTHELNSVAAAREILAGDGSAAVVGTKSLQEEVPGLELLAENIDEGSAFASWWAITRQPIFSERPDFIVATLRAGPDGSLGRLIEAVVRQGFSTRAVGAFPVFSGLSVYDYLVSWTGQGALDAVRAAVASVKSARLAGAFRSG
jgi:prephenate dehydratase